MIPEGKKTSDQKQPSKKEKGIDSGCRHEITEALDFFLESGRFCSMARS